MKEGWEYKKIKDIGTVIGGTTPDTKNPEYWGGEHCWISPAELCGNHYLTDSLKKITDKAVKEKNLKLLPIGSVILSSRAPIGKVTINKVPTYTNQGFKSVICGNEIINEFLYWWFLGHTMYLNSLGTGTTFAEISKKVVEEIIIPVPPLAEQKRIVEYLDAAFARIDAIKAKAKENLDHAQALFQAALTEMMTPKEGWINSTIGEVCTIERGGSPRPIKEYITTDSNGLNWIKIGDTDKDGKYIYTVKEKIKPEGLRKSRWVEVDEFLLSNSMSFGRPYILKTNGCIHDGWLVIRNYQKSLYIDFFYYLLTSQYVQRQFATKAQGSTVNNLNTERVSSVLIGFPSLSEQHRIASYLDAMSAKIDTLKSNFAQLSSECDALKQSLLKQVFE